MITRNVIKKRTEWEGGYRKAVDERDIDMELDIFMKTFKEYFPCKITDTHITTAWGGGNLAVFNAELPEEIVLTVVLVNGGDTMEITALAAGSGNPFPWREEDALSRFTEFLDNEYGEA